VSSQNERQRKEEIRPSKIHGEERESVCARHRDGSSERSCKIDIIRGGNHVREATLGIDDDSISNIDSHPTEQMVKSIFLDD
jgi:hypothetical protein